MQQSKVTLRHRSNGEMGELTIPFPIPSLPLNLHRLPPGGDAPSGPTGMYVQEGVPSQGVQGGGAPRPRPAQREILSTWRG